MSELGEIVVPLDFERDLETGLNRGRGHVVVPIEYDANLPVLGERRVNPYGPCPIVLREWNEQVLLHELLHLILGTSGATPEDPYGHRTVARVEVALWESGWRLIPTPSLCTNAGDSDIETLLAAHGRHHDDEWCPECLCGWRIPVDASDYAAAHRAHVAAVLRAHIVTAQADAWDQGYRTPRVADKSGPWCRCYAYSESVVHGRLLGW
jgi:hypothetical protein